MKLKYKFVITTVDDEMVAVPLESSGQFDGVITVNETMKSIIELLDEERTEDDLVDELLEKYKGVSREELKNYIHDICVGLKNEGLIV